MTSRPLYVLGLLALSFVLAFTIAMLIVIPELKPPANDIRLLSTFMAGTGGLTLAVVYLLYRGGLVRWFGSLRWTLLTTIVLTVVLIFANVWVTAQLMFISAHDLVLTTALLIFAGLIAIISVSFMASTLTDRIQALGQAAQRLAQGDLKTRINDKGNDELAQLARTFNLMANSLQEVDEQKQMLEQARRDLIAWVSHDLRTPLAAIRVMNEAMIDGVVNDKETVTRYQESIQKEVQHLSRLIDDLFDLAQMDSGHLKMDRVHTSLHDLISDTIGSLSARAIAQQVTLSGTVDEQVPMVNIAADKLQRVLYNLLDNALNYTPLNGEVTVKARMDSDEVRISVHNTGPAIAPDDLPHIFTSFYMGERSRAQAKRTTRGAGLGLAIARGFIEAHGGRLWVESAPEQGTTFTFSLPLAKSRVPGEDDAPSSAVTRPNNRVPKEARARR